MPRILLLTAFFPPERGGIQTYLSGLISSLNHREIFVLAPSDREALVPLDSPLTGLAEADASVPYTVLRTPLFQSRGPLRVRTQVQALRAAIRAHSPEVIIVGHYLYSFAEAAMRIGAKEGIPVVQLSHGYDLLDELKRSSRRIARVRKQLASMKQVIVTTRYMQERIASAFDLPEDLFSVVPPGVSSVGSVSPAQVENFRARHNIEPSDRVVLSVGRPVPRKGQDVLIRALPEVLKYAPHARLLIAGDGDQSWLQAIAQESGVADRVSFAASLSDEELSAAYSVSDLFCLPNREDEGGDVEGFGIVLLEALSAGLPVVGGRSGGVPEAIPAGDAGILVDGTSPSEISAAILSFLVDDTRLQEHSSAARAYAATQSWDDRAETLRDILSH